MHESIDEFKNKIKKILNKHENEVEKWTKEDLALIKKFIEEESETVLELEEKLKELDQKRNNHNDYSTEELQVFNNVYENTKELKEKIIQSIEARKKEYNKLENSKQFKGNSI